MRSTRRTFALARPDRARLFALLAAACPAYAAMGQWTAINLEPTAPGLVTSQAYGVHAGQQVGIVVVNGETQAAVWSGSPGSYVNLSPAGVPNLFASAALGAHAGVQVGYIAVVNDEGDDFSLAAMWSGTPQSYVDLHPPGFEQSRALAADSTTQAGWVTVNGVPRAALWTGTPASYISLHPTGPTQSIITALDGETQAGYASVGFSHASLWRGTPESWVDMHPVQVPEISVSAVLGAHNGQQAGWAIYGPASGGISHPALWTGSADSYVDLLPAGWRDGMAIATYDGRQAGNARMAGSDYRALVWSGTPGSFENLHDVLPTGYLRSNALGIWNDGVNWYVAGIAVTPGPAFTSDAILWVSPMAPACEPDFNLDGNVDQDDIACLTQVVAGDASCSAQDPDFNGDGNVDQDDIAALEQVVAGAPCP
ncbi:MAG: hypothetical protein SFY69_10040 [Planctomycetota bacterium]|nr:hypothetical protein [Planctomycetota bacterium]